MKLQGIILTAALLSPLTLSATPFSTASAYNIVAIGSTGGNGHTAYAGNIAGGEPDVVGRVLAAGTVNSGSFLTIGSGLGSNDPYGSSSTYALIAGGGLASGSYFAINGHGDAFAPSSNGTIYFNGGGHRVTSDPVINTNFFNDLRDSLDAQTAYLGGLLNNGTSITANFGQLLLVGTNASINIFNLTAAQLASYTLSFTVPAGSTVIVNVSGKAVTFNAAFFYNGSQQFNSQATNKVLFNFPDADTLVVNGELSASVLAPYALITPNADFDGNIIGAEFAFGHGEFHNIEFVGDLPTPPLTPPTPPAVPEPGTLAMVGTGVLSIAGIVGRKRRS